MLPLLLWSDLDFSYTPNPGPGEKPALFLTPSAALDEMQVTCEVGSTRVQRTFKASPAGKKLTVEFPRDPKLTSADCQLLIRYADGFAEETSLSVSWSFGGGLAVDLGKAVADVQAHTLTVRVTGPVESAEIVAYGAGKAELDRSTVQVGAGPGEITLPWVGDPGEVVLLDVTVRSGDSWSGFTFSPWFLEIPHDDVLFASDSDVIDKDEEYKLERTLAELNAVIDKYGSVVPVQLYIAGCTDTVGDGAHNADLSRRRARAIASWLRAHGYTEPIWYHGFGENLLAVPTGDGVDEGRNRRALYMVGASPPPAGSGVPSVSWTRL